MSRNDPRSLGRAYALIPSARPIAGPAGQRFGRGTGSSLEFQEFRDYQAGDDLRHIDWRAYARSEKLTTRLYREEIAATLEVVIDTSASMRLTAAKEAAVRGLVAFLACAAAADHSVRGILAGPRPQPLRSEDLLDPSEALLVFEGATSMMDSPLSGMLRPGTVRVLISDFLFPHSAKDLVRRLGRSAGALILLQVLDAKEADPSARGFLRLDEVESAAWREVEVDERTVQRYHKRLSRLWRGLEGEARRIGGRALRVVSGPGLEQIVRSTLVPAGLVEPR